MRIGLLSDIHGRWDALELAYSALAAESDLIVCLGDIVNGGGDAEACLDFVRTKGFPCVRGNHDDAWLAMSDWASMASENFRFVRNLPVWMDWEGVVLVHDDPAMASDDAGAWRGAQGYIRHQDQAEQAFRTAPVFRHSPRLTAVGHTHVPCLFTTAGQVALHPGRPALLPQGHSCIVNPGAVGGRPRSAWGNTCALLDLAAGTFTVFQLSLPKLVDPWDEVFDRMAP